jgi:hypothetical protein
LIVGTAETETIDADFSAVNCASVQRATFRGRVQLTKSGR